MVEKRPHLLAGIARCVYTCCAKFVLICLQFRLVFECTSTSLPGLVSLPLSQKRERNGPSHLICSKFPFFFFSLKDNRMFPRGLRAERRGPTRPMAPHERRSTPLPADNSGTPNWSAPFGPLFRPPGMAHYRSIRDSGPLFRCTPQEK